jgi:hypothetical protein
MSKKRISWVVITVLVCLSLNVFGLTYWKSDWDGTGDLPTFSDRPKDNCSAKIKGCVPATVIDPNFIMTCAHVYKNKTSCIGRTLRVGDHKNKAEYIIVDARHNTQTDLVVCYIKKMDMSNPKNPPDETLPDSYFLKDPDSLFMDANLAEWAALYDKFDELNKLCVIGSYSWQAICDDGIASDCSDDPAATIFTIKDRGELHWGRNVIDGVGVDSGMRIDLRTTFDCVKNVNHKYEANGIPIGNSGAGYFIKDGENWKIAGFLSKWPRSTSPEVCYTSRISTSVQWIRRQIADMYGKTASGEIFKLEIVESISRSKAE